MPPLSISEATRPGWRAIVNLFNRPQRVTVPLVVLLMIFPVYLFIGKPWLPGQSLHAPEVALDRAISVWPAWSLVYGSLFLAALLPVFVVHRQELFQRMVLAFLMLWLVSYGFFLAYPTISPRQNEVIGEGFFVWVLRAIYSSDTRYNCFPSLHVAQCFLAALTCYRVHRGVGAVAGVWAFLVAVSTLFTKQHYVLDAIAGAFLACLAYVLLLRSYPREEVPEHERRLAPVLAMGAFGVYGLVVIGFWFVYLISNT